MLHLLAFVVALYSLLIGPGTVCMVENLEKFY